MKAPKRRTKKSTGVTLDAEVREYEKEVKNAGLNFSALVNELIKRSSDFKEWSRKRKEKNNE